MCIQAARAPLFLTGYSVETSRANICYKEYLGPDWIQEWEGASVIIGNHISCLDPMLGVVEYYPSVLTLPFVKNAPIIGAMADSMGCIYVDRVGAVSRESKKETFAKISTHVSDFASGAKSNPLLIFPEGSTTNGRYLLQFKRGAFACLPVIQPFLLSYGGEVSPDMIALTPLLTFYLCCCGGPSVLSHVKLPVFKPN
jgi:lysophosphatidylcholine acyltransferase/lyso-PAF acetyltransferase